MNLNRTSLLLDLCGLRPTRGVKFLDLSGERHAVFADDNAVEIALVVDVNRIAGEDVFRNKGRIKDGDVGDGAAPCAVGEKESRPV